MGGREKGKTTHVAVVATGSRAEVQPHLALAVALARRGGFTVRFVSHAVHGDVAKALGLGFAPLRGDPAAVMRSSAYRSGILSGSQLALAALLKAETDKHHEANMAAIHAATRDVDAIVCAIAVLTECLAVAQKYQIAAICAPLLPYSPTGELPLATLLPEPMSYMFLNKLTYDLNGLLMWSLLGPSINKFRTAVLGIGPQAGYVLEGVPQVAAFSTAVVPRPRDWGSHVHTSGLWRLPDALAPPPAHCPTLAALLAAPSADARLRPMFACFESTPLPDPIAFLRAAHAAVVKFGVPLIFAAAETDMGAVRSSPRVADLDGVVYELDAADAGAGAGAGVGAAARPPLSAVRIVVVREAPYAWALPRCSLVLHAGGATITQAGMEAGIPALPWPAFGSDFFWAARAAALGVAPPLAHPLRLLPEKLEESLTIARLPALREAAAALGAAIRGAGDGAAVAAAHVRAVLARPQHRHCGVTCAWVPDESSPKCSLCETPFTLVNRRRHCRSCGRLACGACLALRCHLPGFPEDAPQITCERCLDARRSWLAMHAGVSPLPPLPGGGAGRPADDGATTDVALGGGGGGGGGGAGAGAGAGSSGGGELRTPGPSESRVMRSPEGIVSPLPV